MTTASRLVFSNIRIDYRDQGLKPLPNIVWSAFLTVNKVHRIWKFYTKAELYRNPENWLGLLAGKAINLVFGHSIILRIAAQAVLIAERIFECVEQQSLLIKSWHAWIDAILDTYPRIYPSWMQAGYDAGIKERVIVWAGVPLKKLYHRVETIFFRTIRLCKNFFLLSMKMIDAIEAFSLSPATKNEGINEIFLNSAKLLDKLTENHDLLIEGLRQNKEMINKILSGIHCEMHTDELISKVESAIQKTASVCNKIKSTSSTALKAAKYIARKEIFNLMHRIRLAKHLPRWLIPEPGKSPWYKPLEAGACRCPPASWLTKPSRLKPIMKTTRISTKEKKKFNPLTTNCHITVGNIDRAKSKAIRKAKKNLSVLNPEMKECLGVACAR